MERIPRKTKFFNIEDSVYIGNLEKQWNTLKGEVNIVFNFNDYSYYSEEDKSEIISKIMNSNAFKDKSYNVIEYQNDDLLNYIEKENSTICHIIFDTPYKYTIKMRGNEIPLSSTNILGNYSLSRMNPLTILSNKYYKFSYLQSVIDSAIISFNTNTSITYDIDIGNLVKPPIRLIDMRDVKLKMYSMVLNFIFIIYIPSIVNIVVEEKEKKIKDIMLLYGYQTSEFTLSWEIIYLIISAVNSLIITFLLTITNFVVYHNFLIIFIMITLYGLSNCGIGLIISTFIKGQRHSRIKSFCITTMLFISFFSITYANRRHKLFLNVVLSPVSFGRFIEEIQDSNIDIKEWTYIALLLSSNIIYFITTFNLDVFQRMLKHRNSRRNEEDNYYYKQNIEKYNNFNDKCILNVSNVSKIFKRVPVEIENEKAKSYPFLSKTKKEEFYALNHINFKVYNNEIFCILGHSGSGKSSLFHILTGLIKPSYGTVCFEDLDTITDFNKIRNELGFCPQWNILFDELTVEDHISLVSKMKNVKTDINEILKEIDLDDKKDTLTRNLRESDKRKLSIAISFIGNPKYVILDEPTVNHEYKEKRKIWEYLFNKKKERIIVITTSDMTEADILGDHKLILSHGDICCLGTNDFIKNHFNIKYNLSIENDCESNEFIMDRIAENDAVPNNNNNVNNNNRLSINSNSNRKTWEIPISCINKLQEVLKNINTRNISISIPTLEESYYHFEESKKCEEFDDDSNYDICINNEEHLIKTNEELPKIKKENISRSRKIKTLIIYRTKSLLHNKHFISYALLFPYSLGGIISMVANYNMLRLKFLYNNYVTYTSDLNNKYYDIFSNSNKTTKLLLNVNDDIGSIPNLKDSLYNNYMNSSDNFPFEITNYNDNELNEICKTIDGNSLYLSSISGNVHDDKYKFNIYYNASIDYSLPETINILSNAILSTKHIEQKIETKAETINQFTYDNYLTFIHETNFVCFALGIIFFSGLISYGSAIIKEKISQIAHHYQLNGISRNLYWTTVLIGDSIFNIIFLIIINLPLIFKLNAFDATLLLVYTVYTIGSLCFQYILSSIQNSEKGTYSYFLIIHMTISLIGITVSSITNIFTFSYNPYRIFTNRIIIIEIIFIIIYPPFTLIGISNALYIVYYYTKYTNLDDYYYIFNLDSGIFYLVAILLGTAIFYYCLLVSIDQYKNKSRIKYIRKLDTDTFKEKEKMIEKNEDVYKEYRNVKNNHKNYAICVINLSREIKIKAHNIKSLVIEDNNYHYGDLHKSLYNKKETVITLVDNITFGVKKNECFGILGPKGSGKSTIMKMLALVNPQTSGKIYYNGKISHNCKLEKMSLSYCAQDGQLWDFVTVRNHIECELKMNGYRGDIIKSIVLQYVNYFDLENDIDTQVYGLSEIAKIKLRLILALCHSPDTLIIDEPTSNMNPDVKEKLWNTIKSIKEDNNTTVIISTNSLEEARNLCDRIGIIVNGSFVYIGTPEYIENKYCKNKYILNVQSEDIEEFHQKIIKEDNILGDDYIKEEIYYNRVSYEVTIHDNTGINIGKIFEIMEQCKASDFVTDYSFSEFTFEQFYLKLSKYQINNNQYCSL